MSVPFRFDTVLRIRRAERDRLVVALHDQLQNVIALDAEQTQATEERASVLDSLRTLNNGREWTAEQILSRMNHADRLAQDLGRIAATLADAVTAAKQCRQELLEADQSVKAFEKMASVHEATQRLAEESKAQREREDNWYAA